MGYAELHALSNFTFLRGASHPEELVERAAELGYDALALTDECSVAGIVRALVAAEERGLKLIVGSEFTVSDFMVKRDGREPQTYAPHAYAPHLHEAHRPHAPKRRVPGPHAPKREAPEPHAPKRRAPGPHALGF